MSETQLLKFIRPKDYIPLLISKIYINGFNVFVSIMIQFGVGAALDKQILALYKILFILVLASLLYALIYYFYSMYSERLKKRIVEYVAKGLISSALMKVDLTQDNGTMVNLVNQDANNVANYFMMGLMPTIDFLMIITGGLTYTFINSWIFGIVYSTIGIIIYVISRYYYVKDVEFRVEFQKDDDNQKNFIPDVYNNLPIIRVFNVRNWVLSVNNRLYQYKQRSLEKDVTATSSSAGIVRGGIYVVEIMALSIGLLLVNMQQLRFDVMLGIWNVGIGSVFDPFLSLPIVLSFMAQQQASMKRIRNNFIYQGTTTDVGGNDSEVDITDIEAKQITYKYPNNQAVAIKDLSFHIAAKKITFIVGKNGAGKTTLLSILQGVLPNFSGSIVVNTKQKMVLPSLNGQSAFVPQKGQLFSNTINSNLTLDKPIDKAKVIEVLSKVNMWETIKELPKGLKSVVGEDTNFSKGQIRRLAIARALLLNRQFLVLDEPFSDIDFDTQKTLMELLRKLSSNMGIIIVTHTYDFVKSTDGIIRVGGLNE
ncbi:ABC transporter ATP-binding protein [Lentilactobacillus sp. Marseille-Q4993]|uniref:ATP-binding cassette domain-containing protein n=1 Tax=Lentilactobacillus sp. Marseille-Q4993 TaxID=3039492 RepID=UPI0024BCB594|nr:ABC transporter ATP-binding protein [Lentilactobacillus sp. Marseille-Q4993]